MASAAGVLFEVASLIVLIPLCAILCEQDGLQLVSGLQAFSPQTV